MDVTEVETLDDVLMNATGRSQVEPVGVFEEDTQQLSVPRTFIDENELLDLDEIRTLLAKIAEILSDDEDEVDEDADVANLSTVDMSIGQLAELAEGLFKEGHPQPEAAGRNVGVRIADLYEQLKTGKVVTTMSRMLTEVPHEMLANPADALSKDEVSIPLHFAVTSVRPDELVRRTPSTEMEIGLPDMPNLFSMGASGPTATHSEPVGAEADLFGAASPAATPSMTNPEPQPAAPEVPEPPQAASPVMTNPEPQPAVPEVQEQPPTAPPVVPDEGPAMTVKEQLDRELKLDDEIFARTMNVSKPAMPEPEAVRETPPVEPPAPASRSGFSLEFNEDATPFRRASEVPAQEPVTAIEPVDVAEDNPPAAHEGVAEEPAYETDAHETVDPGAVEADPASTGVFLGCVDLNEASVEALVENVTGLGSRLAEDIVTYRDQIGGFTSPADLRNVPGMEPTTYERLAGEPWSSDCDHLKETVESILGTDPDGLPDFRDVADRFCETQNFTGCMIVHTDGHVLASVCTDENSDILGAIAPQIFKKVVPYAEQLGHGDVNPISLVFGGKVITLACSGELLIAAIHQLDQLDQSQLRLIQRVGAELEARMDHVKA